MVVATSWKEAVTFGTLNEGPRLDPDLMFEDVFKEMPQNLLKQRALMRSEKG
jgi:2-oxoisovalerate dehydrogenase E1 component alpha subunit